MPGIPAAGQPVKQGHNLQRECLGLHYGGDSDSDGDDYSDDEEVDAIIPGMGGL